MSKEAATKAARNFVDACAVVPVAAHCRAMSIALTGGDVAGKLVEGDGHGALVQLGSVAAGEYIGSKVGVSLSSTGAYSQGFIDWMKNMYGAGIEKIIQGVHDSNSAKNESSQRGTNE